MPHPLGATPGKIIAVHLNYAGRARERGRTPDRPSFFLKPASSLAGTGDPVTRPPGCELLAFEGEIALVIGARARRVPPERGWQHVTWITAANDFGVYDLRYADRGSNLRSKGADGFTPVGARLLDAARVDPGALRLRTWVNGELAQDATTDELLFDFGTLIADLSDLVTLEPGDVILTGTPAGSTVTAPGDVVEVQVDTGGENPRLSTGRLRSPIVAGDREPSARAAPPRADAAARAAALGPVAAPGLTDALRAALHTVATATLSAQLRKRGLGRVALDGLRPLCPGQRLVGTARTLRYLPLREDLFERHGTGMNAQKRAIEQVEPGDVLVIDARRDAGAGTIGDILALRAQRRGAAGIVTDGALRDSAAIAALGIPTYHAGTHPSVLGRRHVPWESGCPVACGGVLVQPGDLLVGDDDGVLLLPPDLAAEVTEAAVEQERQERFIAERVAAGEPIEGLYPLGAAKRAEYRRWRHEHDDKETG